MKNLLTISSLSLIIFSFFISPTVFAEDVNKEINPGKIMVLATVNIQDTKIISQEGNNFKISFSISNREGLQSGVKYGVKLYSQDTKGKNKSMVDEKVYDEVLSLSSNSIIKKEINYTAPSVLNGKYSLILFSYNSKGFPFAFSEIGTINLTSSIKGIEILTDSCFTYINKETSQYKIGQSVSIKKEDTLHLNCKVLNSSDKSINVTPIYETKLNSPYGDSVISTGGDTNTITVKGLEKKDISIILPTKSLIPQTYSLNFSLKENENISNSINVVYNIFGIKATIYNASLDKDIYRRGDMAKLSIMFNLSNLSGDTVDKTNLTRYYLNTVVTDGKDRKCGNLVSKEIDQNFKSPIDFSINKRCQNPKVFASIIDNNGIILSQIGTEPKNSLFDLDSYKYIVIIFILLILLMSIIYLKKKKHNIPQSSTLSIFLLILAFSFLGSFLSVEVASADTLCYLHHNSVDSVCEGESFLTISFDNNKVQYHPGETVTIKALLTTNVIPSYTGHTLPVYKLRGYNVNSSGIADLSSSTIVLLSDGSVSTLTLTAPALTGSGSMGVHLVATRDCAGDNSRIDPLDKACANPAGLLTEGSSANVNLIINGVSKTVKKQTFSFGNSNIGIANTDQFRFYAYGYEAASRDTFQSYANDQTVQDLVKDISSDINSFFTPFFFATSYKEPLTLWPSSIYSGVTLTTYIDPSRSFSANVYNSDYESTWDYVGGLDYTVVAVIPPTVTVLLNGSPGNKTVVNKSPVRVSWDSPNASSCTCTYDTDKDCTPEYPTAGYDIQARGNPFTFSQSKTFSVTCTNVPYCHGTVTQSGYEFGVSCSDTGELGTSTASGCASWQGCSWY